MSVYNGEKYLSEAIESILNQTYSNFEFLIIDDGSTDSTRQIILSYDDYRIRLIENDSNIGLTESLNKGIDFARGKYIARMDADDISMPERLEKQVDFMESHEDVAVCGSWAIIIDEKGKAYDSFKNPEHSIEIEAALFFYNPIAHPTVLMKKGIVNFVGNYDSFFLKTQDYDLWIRLFLTGYSFYNLQETLLIYRNHKQNITNTNLDVQLYYADKCLQNLYSQYFGKKNINTIVSAIRSLFLNNQTKLNILIILKIILLLKTLKKKFLKHNQIIKSEDLNRYLFMVTEGIKKQYKKPWKIFLLNISFKILGLRN